MEHYYPSVVRAVESSGHPGHTWVSPKARGPGAHMISGYQNTRRKAETWGSEVLAYKANCIKLATVPNFCLILINIKKREICIACWDQLEGAWIILNRASWKGAWLALAVQHETFKWNFTDNNYLHCFSLYSYKNKNKTKISMVLYNYEKKNTNQVIGADLNIESV